MKKSNLVILILSILVVLLVIFAIIGKQKGIIGGDKPIKVTVEKCSRQDIVQTVTANGKIYPEIEVKISSDVSGEVVELYVEEGDSVKKGQLVARIQADSYNSVVEQVEATKNNARASLEAAKARKKQAEANLINAESMMAKYRQLYAGGNASKIELENYEKVLLTAKAEVEAADQTIKGFEYSVQAADATIKEARNNLNKTSIYAPIDGIVSVLNVEKGEKVVGTLQMSGTEMMRIADFENMEARVKVSENDVIHVHRGDTAIIEIDAYPDTKFKGVVTSIASSSQGLSGNSLVSASTQSTSFEVKIRILKFTYTDLLKEYTFPFRPGMSATTDIRTKSKKDVIAIPLQAVTTRDVNKDSIGMDELLVEYIFLNDNGTAVMKEVTTGIQNDSYIEVIEGVDADEIVITAPYSAISKDLENGKAVLVVSKEELYGKKK